MQTKEKSPFMLAHEEGSNLAFVFSDQEHNSKQNTDCQSDDLIWKKTDTEISLKFTPKKNTSLLLSESYLRLGLEGKSQRVSDCGSYLEFAHEISSEGEVSETGKLHSANFCRDRMCPMCSWRRSYKIFGQVSQIMEIIGDKYKFLFLTLTVPNCAGADLAGTLDRMMNAFRKFIRYKDFKVVKGFFRALEITRNKDPKSKSYGTYHPHFHVVLAVPKMYGKGSCYVGRDRWLELWQKAMKDPSITQVDIRVARDKNASESASQELASAVAEIAKYAVKDSDYIYPGQEDLTDQIVTTLTGALHHRRLVAYGGVFQDAFEKLKLDDPEDGDLVHINEKLNPALAWLIVKYGWSCGTYKMTDAYIKTPGEGVNDDE